MVSCLAYNPATVVDGRPMSQRVVTTGLIVAVLVAAWLRFDAAAVVMSWCVVLICLTGAIVAWILHARRLPPTQLPAEVQPLATREELTPREEAQFKGTLQAWHRKQQETAFREIADAGAGPLIRARAALYFLWLSFAALAVLPSAAVPATFLSRLPRFLIVVLPLGLIAVAAAVPLGIRDWRRARNALDSEF
jgi:hypothetical protein